MIFSPDGRKITKLPHKKEWDMWVKRLNKAEYAAIHSEIMYYVDELVSSDTRSAKMLMAKWITGDDWNGTVFQRIYEVMGGSETLAGYFVGLFVWVVLSERLDFWMVTKEEDVIGKIYHMWDPERGD